VMSMQAADPVVLSLREVSLKIATMWPPPDKWCNQSISI
jgi:hypothetical protein